VSPGQWGNDLAYALWFIALGGLVTQRAAPLGHQLVLPAAILAG
jgi:hypothetical protein